MQKKLISCFVAASICVGLSCALPWENETVSAQEYVQLTAEQMKAALRCPTEESQQFVDNCFKLVALGKLPESFVLSAFQYAMGKSKVTNRWYYFEKSLALRCEKMGIDLYKEIEGLNKS